MLNFCGRILSWVFFSKIKWGEKKKKESEIIKGNNNNNTDNNDGDGHSNSKEKNSKFKLFTSYFLTYSFLVQI